MPIPIPVPIFVEGFTSTASEFFNFYAHWAPIFAGLGVLLNLSS
ncbi:Uncharacterised protein [Corynebacterium kutscheri]|uniref:Uncharacterized protein n=1 Tax=Corynebacterium kutscheri TaxID=35755 RepID=A0A0F6QYF1_9CORY|nr:hypothetical protein UL82_01520 [Corynebacterium kutscheri]VEH05015.1 Uncharacterised protein [Corynebacterium kutscheri]VEH10927.1 Uncharacterised protein [Corynebacterium kutscheri]VEH80597.1 Uncharacterised protein [Corynebacterium kutscheri]